jgi:hypothetical protein
MGNVFNQEALLRGHANYKTLETQRNRGRRGFEKSRLLKDSSAYSVPLCFKSFAVHFSVVDL